MSLLRPVALKPDCVYCGEVLRFDPVEEVMSFEFRCAKFPARADCSGCLVCTKCGDAVCSCGFMGIYIRVKFLPTIETVALRDRIG